jgi:hypothetical protein
MTTIALRTDKGIIHGDFQFPETSAAQPMNICIFAHGAGSSRFSPRNRFLASLLNQVGIATLLMDLLTESEEREDEISMHLRFNIPMLSHRVVFFRIPFTLV